MNMLGQTRQDYGRLASYSPGFYISPVFAVTILLLVFIAELRRCVLDEFEGLQHGARVRKLNFSANTDILSSTLFPRYFSVQINLI